MDGGSRARSPRISWRASSYAVQHRLRSRDDVHVDALDPHLRGAPRARPLVPRREKAIRRERPSPRLSGSRARVAESSASDDAGASSSALSTPPADSNAARSLEFMVEMSCGKCVSGVEAACASVPGVEAVVATLATNTVRVVARDANADAISAAVENAGYNCRLIGQGDVDVFGEELAARLGTNLRTLRNHSPRLPSSKGASTATATLRASSDSSRWTSESPSSRAHSRVSPRETTRSSSTSTATPRAASTRSDPRGPAPPTTRRRVDPDVPAGRIGDVVADEKGGAIISSRVLGERVKVWDVIGRSLGVHPNGDESEGAAAVLARSAGRVKNLKRVCQCDGTVIWESGPDDFKSQTVAGGDEA